MIISDTLAALALKAIKNALPGAKLYYFAGPVPATPDEALDMASKHTQCVAITLNGSGGGLSFEEPTGAILSKPPSDVWEGSVTFDGAQASQPSLSPTFFRIGKDGDDCRGQASASGRIQGTIGDYSSSADIRLSDGRTVTAGGDNKRKLPIFNIRLVPL